MTRSESSTAGAFASNACCRPHDLFKNIFNMVGDGICVTDDVGHIIRVNKTLCEMTGYAEQELIGMHGTDLSPEVDYPALPSTGCRESISLYYKNIFEDFYKRGGDISMYYAYYQKKDKSIFPVEMRITNVSSPAGLTAAIIICARDITERKQLEEEREKALKEIAQARDFLKAVFDMTGDGIYVTDDWGNIVGVNKAFCAMLGYTEAELIGKYASDITPKLLASGRDEAIANEMFYMDSSNYFELLYQRKDGTIFPGEAKITNFQNGSAGIIVSLRDITERKEFENQLRAARDELEQKVKDRTINLEEANTALRVLLKGRNDDIKNMEEKMMANVNELIMPYIKKLRRTSIKQNQMVLLDAIRSNLNDIMSPFALSTKFSRLTPTEIQVANLIKIGRNTKEIAEMLNLSPRTVEGHRDKIRKKLGIKNQSINLRTHLTSLE